MVRIKTYGIANQGIVDALIDRHHHGVEVIVAQDKLQSPGRSSLLEQLTADHIRVVIKKSAVVLEHNIYDWDSCASFCSWCAASSLRLSENDQRFSHPIL